MSSYVFILCPPYSGSTILWKLISTSSAVSSLPSEGQFLPEVTAAMRQDPWNSEIKLEWQKIKEIWDGYWDQSKPLLVEKSPPHMIRVKEILKHFSPVCFLVMVRNPYAHCEGLIRRNGWSVRRAAEFTARCISQQKSNVEQLENALSFTYEEFTGNPESTSRRIQRFLPEIGALKYRENFTVHSIDGIVERGIVNLNQKKLANLTASDLKAITRVLRGYDDAMRYWRYEFIEERKL